MSEFGWQLKQKRQLAVQYIYILNRIYYVAAKQSYGKTCEEERQARPVGNGLRQSLRA